MNERPRGREIEIKEGEQERKNGYEKPSWN